MKISDFISEEGRVSSTKTTEKYISRHHPDEHQKIISFCINLGIEDVSFPEKLYHYLHNLNSRVVCKNCGSEKIKYFGLKNGYSDYCSSKCSNSSPEVQDKKEKKYLEKYGVKNPSHSEEVKKKIEKTFHEKFGGNPMKLDVFKDKVKNTVLKKHGVESMFSKNSKYRIDLREKIREEFNEKNQDLDIIEFDGRKHGHVKINCKQCGNDYIISKWNLHQRKKSLFSNPCTVCNPVGQSHKSGMEDFIQSILEEAGEVFEKRIRGILGRLEIDFYIPGKNIGFEIDGLYWHSDEYKTPSYHLEKTRIAKESGVKLYHIFEDEIIHNKEIVKNRINSILGIYDRRIFARKCQIKELNTVQASEFLDLYHIQGIVQSPIRYGLYFEGELVSVMTFGKLRRVTGLKSKDGKFELLRFCNKSGVQVVGGAQKLLTHFIKENKPESVISYCDRRWSHGNLYEKLGFQLTKETNPNYWYVGNKNGWVREHRYKYRKDILVSEGEDQTKSEASIMKDRGFFRIYDCGSLKYEMNFTSQSIQ